MRDLSVIIPARNEEFLGLTIDDILKNKRADTEVIVILDGYWPDPPIQDQPNVTLIHHTDPIGQRAGTNEGAKVSQAKYVMKCDAHCAFDEGFDVKLMADMEPDWTVIPRMYNLHCFDWVCDGCGHRIYQDKPHDACEKCGSEMKKEIIWKPRIRWITDFARFDEEMHFQYWKDYKNRPEAKGDIVDVMSSVGACFFMERERFWELEGMDEAHGSWGQFGTEIACKSWLSGGRQVVNKKTWFSHMFRTKVRDGFGFPYQIKKRDQTKAQEYSKDLWLNDKWPKAERKLSWLVDKFSPVPTWEEGEVGEKKILSQKEMDLKIREKFRIKKKRDNLPIKASKGGRNGWAEFLGENGFNRGVEIGVQRGKFSEVLCKANPNIELYSIDCWHSGRRPKRAKQKHDEAIARLAPFNVTIIHKRSMDALSDFENMSLDFAYIDANHNFEHVCPDLIFWAEKVRSGGIIGCHDYYNFGMSGVIEAVNAYTRCFSINPWYVTHELEPTAFWVKP